MTQLLLLLIAFLLFGWLLPSGSWGIILLLLGIMLTVSGLVALFLSFRQPGLTSGLGNVLVAFAGFCIVLVGLHAGGWSNVADELCHWVEGVPTAAVVGGSFALGIVLAAISSLRR